MGSDIANGFSYGENARAWQSQEVWSGREEQDDSINKIYNS